MIEKTRPNARVSFSGYTATHTTDEKSSDSSQKNALKLTSSLFVVGVLVQLQITHLKIRTMILTGSLAMVTIKRAKAGL